MNPPGQGERAVVQERVGFGAIAWAGLFIEILADRVVGGKCHQLVEVGDGPLQGNLQRAVVYGYRAQAFQGQLAAGDGFGVFDAVQDERVLRRVGRIQGQAPGENEIVGRYRLAVAPQRVFAEPERGAVVVHLPAFGHAGHQLVVLIVAEQSFHDVPQHHAAEHVRGQRAVELRRLRAHVQRQRVGFGVHAGCGVGGGAGQAGSPAQRHHQQGYASDARHRKHQQLPAGGPGERLVRCARVTRGHWCRSGYGP